MANWFRIKPAQRSAPVLKIDTSQKYLSVKEVALQNNITHFNNIGVKSLNKELYYLFLKDKKVLFFNAKTSEKLTNGSEKYASYLGRYYLGDTVSSTHSVSLITSFNSEYKVINRHLPVYKVSFKDAAKSDVYVHIPSGGLGTINDGFKRTQLWVFSNFHNWDFLGNNHTIKPFFVFVFSLATFIVGVLGLYIYFSNRKKYKKRKKGNKKLRHRNIHRYFSVPVAAFYLMFSFSGAYHAFQKFQPYFLNQYEPNEVYTTAHINNDFWKVINSTQLQRISLVSLNNNVYYRIASTNRNAPVSYYQTNHLNSLPNADKIYAIQRALQITKLPSTLVKEVNLITKFENEYGFINKRLPVYEVVFNDAKEKVSVM